jgi:hypothetical protein
MFNYVEEIQDIKDRLELVEKELAHYQHLIGIAYKHNKKLGCKVCGGVGEVFNDKGTVEPCRECQWIT